MKSILLKSSILVISVLFSSSFKDKDITDPQNEIDIQEFQGKAIYVSKSTMDLGRWGARMSEEQ